MPKYESTMFTIPATSIRAGYISPFLYRYENTKYVDKFFETGELRLSSFSSYRSYPDNQLGDPHEGYGGSLVSHRDFVFHDLTTVGANEYCFCTSTVYSSDHQLTFNRDSAFKIVLPINFIIEVSKVLANVVEVFYGNCIYGDRTILNDISSVDRNEFRDLRDPTGYDVRKLLEASESLRLFFLKDIAYQTQCEYRIIWHMNHFVTDSLTIKCPNAVQYCERIPRL